MDFDPREEFLMLLACAMERGCTPFQGRRLAELMRQHPEFVAIYRQAVQTETLLRWSLDSRAFTRPCVPFACRPRPRYSRLRRIAAAAAILCACGLFAATFVSRLISSSAAVSSLSPSAPVRVPPSVSAGPSRMDDSSAFVRTARSIPFSQTISSSAAMMIAAAQEQENSNMKKPTLGTASLAVAAATALTSTAAETMNNLTNLQVWLDASDSATVIQTAIPGYVQYWSDKSGHSNDASPSSAATMPATGVATLNGLNLVSFSTSGTADRLNNATMPALGDTNRTVIFVAQPFDTATSDIIVGLGSSAVAGALWGITDTTVYGYATPYDRTGLATFGNMGGANAQIMMVSYNNTNALRRLTNGGQVSSTTRSENPYNTSAGYVLGNWGNLDRPYSGNVAEVLVFDRVISEAERIILENHLAAKWNPDMPVITLAAASQRYAGYTAANGNYDRDVFGIGRVNSSNAFLSCNTFTGLRLNAAASGDDDWLLVGHKTATNAVLTAGLAPGAKERWARVWYLDKTDADDSLTATLTFDFSEGGVSTNGSQYDLLYSATDPFVFRSVAQSSVVSNQVAFTVTSSQIDDGYYTVGRAVGGGLSELAPLVWLDAADTNMISRTNSTVAVWYNKSKQAGNNASQSDTNAQPSTGVATLNGLNLISFSASGTSDRLNNQTMTALGDGSRTVIFFSQPFDTESGDIVVGLSTSGSAGTAWGLTDTTIYGFAGPYDVTGLAAFGNRGGSAEQIMMVTYNNAAQKINRYRNGTAVTVNANRSSSAYATAAGYIVGNWSGSGGNRPFTGDVGEILIFDRVLSEAERIMLENHLTAKWNPDTPVITLAIGSQRYAGYTAANGNYDRDVWGIGRVNSSTDQLLTGETGTGLRLSASSLGDDDWLLAGHRTATNAVLTVGVEPNVKERWARVWYLDKTDADGSLTATLTFDFEIDDLAAGGVAYDLIYSADEPFAFHALQRAEPIGGQVTFTLTSAQLQDGYYTLGRAKRGTLISVY